MMILAECSVFGDITVSATFNFPKPSNGLDFANGSISEVTTTQSVHWHALPWGHHEHLQDAFQI